MKISNADGVEFEYSVSVPTATLDGHAINKGQADDTYAPIGATDVTYAELAALIGASGLIPEAFYRITDFATRHYIVDADGTAYTTPVAQVDTLTLTGSSGTANVGTAGGLTKLATFDTDLATTAANFVTAHAAAYAAVGITVTNDGDSLVFTAAVAGTAFANPTIANASGDLDGTVANTTQNDAGSVTGATEPLIVQALAADEIGSLAFSADYPGDVIRYDWDAANWLSDLSLATGGDTIISGWKGVITFRHDTIADNSAHYDWRNVLTRRWETDAVAWDIGSAPYAIGSIVSHGTVVYIAVAATSEEPGTGSEWATILDLSEFVYWNSSPVSTGNVPSGATFMDFGLFRDAGCVKNHLGITSRICGSNTFGADCSYNKFDADCIFNTLGAGCAYNVFAAGCGNNVFNASCEGNTFGVACNSNLFGASCSSNTFFGICNSNTFGASCSSNTFDTGCNSNTFSSTCCYNTFGPLCEGNVFGATCNHNRFGSTCSFNIFGLECSANTFGAGCASNVFGIACTYNTITGGSESLTFGSTATMNTVHTGVNSLDFSAATHVYGAYSCDLILDAGSTARVRYIDASGVQQIALATA